MRHTLSSRFQGGFLGAAIGEMITVMATHPFKAKAGAAVDFRGSSSVIASSVPGLVPESSAPPWGKWAIDQMCCLTRSPSAFSEPLAEFAEPPSSAGLAIALLPLAFFYHENINLFRHQVQQRLDQWQLSSEVGMGAIVMGHAISLILREQCQPLNLIPQLLAEIPDPQNALVTQLTQVQSWLVEASTASQFSTHRLAGANSLSSTSVSPILVSLETIPIALALYAFLSTSDDFRLSLLRVAQFPGQTRDAHSLTCSLTAALSGTHNGRGGLPQDWRRLLHNDLERRSSLLWGVTESELLECVDRFISAWSGVHNPVRPSLRSRTPIAVTIPRIIRPT